MKSLLFRVCLGYCFLWPYLSLAAADFTQAAEDYLSAIHFKEKIPEQIRDYLVSNFLTKAELTPPELDELSKLVSQEVKRIQIDKKMEAHFVEVYQQLGFQVEDMQRILSFVKTPSGRKFQQHELAIIQQLNQKSEEVLTRYAQDLTEIVDKIQFKAMQRRAKTGDLEAAYHVYHFYLLGKGTVKDPVTALVWLKKAAEAGYAMAQNNLGYHYSEGDILKKDQILAVDWYQKAAQQQNPVAMTNLAQQYFRGYANYKPDYQKAFQYYHQAAMYGEYCAQFALGYLYAKGYYVKTNDLVAEDWFIASAIAGLPDQFSLTTNQELSRYAKEFSQYELAKIRHHALPKLAQDQLLMFDQFDELNIERCL